jgi:hypothetical protein
VLALQRVPGDEHAATAALVGEGVDGGQRLLEPGVARLGPLAVVDQQNVEHVRSFVRRRSKRMTDGTTVTRHAGPDSPRSGPGNYQR